MVPMAKNPKYSGNFPLRVGPELHARLAAAARALSERVVAIGASLSRPAAPAALGLQF